MTEEDLTETKTDEKGRVYFDVNKENPSTEDLREASKEAVEKLLGDKE